MSRSKFFAKSDLRNNTLWRSWLLTERPTRTEQSSFGMQKRALSNHDQTKACWWPFSINITRHLHPWCKSLCHSSNGGISDDNQPAKEPPKKQNGPIDVGHWHTMEVEKTQGKSKTCYEKSTPRIESHHWCGWLSDRPLIVMATCCVSDFRKSNKKGMRKSQVFWID